MFITFDVRPEDDIEGNRDIWVDVQAPPVLPLCEFLNHIYVFDIVFQKKLTTNFYWQLISIQANMSSAW